MLKLVLLKFKNVIILIARQLPSKLAVERIAAWLGVVTFLIGSVWTLWTYQASVHVSRVNTTLEFYHKFTERFDPIIGQYARRIKSHNEKQKKALIKERCLYIMALLMQKQLKQKHEEDIDCLHWNHKKVGAIFSIYDLNSNHRNILRGKTEPIIKAINTDYNYIEVMLDYMAAISVCVNKGNCDAPTTVELFYGPMIQLLNNTCNTHSKKLEPRSRRYQIIKLLVENDGHEKMRAETKDPSQESMFYCGNARNLEEKLSHQNWLIN